MFVMSAELANDLPGDSKELGITINQSRNFSANFLFSVYDFT